MRRTKATRSGFLCGTRNENGFTFTELLVTVLIVTLVSIGVSLGMSFGVRQYHQSMIQSESRILCSTLSTAIQEELSYTGTVTLGADDSVQSFFNSVYGDSGFYAVSVNEDQTITRLGADDYGELYLGTDDDGRLVLSSAAYSSYGLGARIDDLTYDKSSNIFHVSLSIGLNGDTVVSSSFDVVPINEVNVVPAA